MSYRGAIRDESTPSWWTDPAWDQFDHLREAQTASDADALRVFDAMAIDNDPFADKPTPEPGDSL